MTREVVKHHPEGLTNPSGPNERFHNKLLLYRVKPPGTIKSQVHRGRLTWPFTGSVRYRKKHSSPLLAGVVFISVHKMRVRVNRL